LANLLEQFHVDTTDRQIAIEIGLPFLMSYDAKN